MRVTPDTLDHETVEHVIDMVAKALFARTDRSEMLVTWDELESASNMKCEIEKCSDGVTLRRQS